MFTSMIKSLERYLHMIHVYSGVGNWLYIEMVMGGMSGRKATPFNNCKCAGKLA